MPGSVSFRKNGRWSWVGAVVSPWRSETISQKQEGAGRHSSPDEKTHVCGPLSSAQVFYIGWCGAVCFRCPDLFSRIKTNSYNPRDWLTNWKGSSPLHRLTTQDSLLLTQGCPCANGEVLNMKKRKTASRIAHNLAPGQPHTQTPTNMRRTLPWLKEPIQREESRQFLYIDYIWNIDLPRWIHHMTKGTLYFIFIWFELCIWHI